MFFGIAAISIPVYWLGEMVSLVTQGGLHNSIFAWVPNGGYVSLTQNPWQWALHSSFLAHVGESLRGNLRRVLRANDQQYERGLHSHRPSQRPLRAPDPLSPRTAMLVISIVSLFGLDVGVLVGGAALLTESSSAFRESDGSPTRDCKTSTCRSSWVVSCTARSSWSSRAPPST